MHLTHLLGGGLLVATLSWFVATDGTTPPVPPVPPAAEGHYVFVVQGDRDQLTVTHVNAKADPWAGVPKGLRSDWLLRVRGADGALLATVPLDMSAFDLAPERKGGEVEVEGCIVRDPKVAMLVNVPRFVGAASYTFVRREPNGEVPLGLVTGDRVRDLAGGGR
ncbi:MAG: hypothetical protein JNM25_03195 [Planctomycetes bacterium]|nr:hypothetical protein [Planctomycetota bacterium]